MSEQTNTYLISTVLVGVAVVLVRKVYDYYMTKWTIRRTHEETKKKYEEHIASFGNLVVDLEKRMSEQICASLEASQKGQRIPSRWRSLSVELN
jgi:predicted component of type VI protein secretion system